MEDKEFNRLLVKTPQLALKMKACREAGEITLEEASSLSGLDIETLQKVENGEYCQGYDMVSYHRFFLNHVPNAIEIYDACEEGISAQFDYLDAETGEEVTGADLVIGNEDDDEAEDSDEVEVCMPELGPQFKAWREASNMTLEQASQLSGMDRKIMQKVENNQTTKLTDVMAYHDFFMKHIPNARKLYHDFMDQFLAKYGYTYDKEGNEYKDGVPTNEYEVE